MESPGAVTRRGFSFARPMPDHHHLSRRGPMTIGQARRVLSAWDVILGKVCLAMNRRVFLAGGVVLVAAAGAFAAGDGRMLFYAALRGDAPGAVLTADRAHDLATSGDALLVDIRTPDEWAATGIGAGAVALDMRRGDFTAALTRLAGGDRDAQIVLICARGVRSARLGAVLTEVGFTNVTDVPEGMSGSRDGPGWVARGLPVVRP